LYQRKVEFAEFGERYIAVKKIFVKFPRVSKIFGVKEKPLASPKIRETSWAR